MFPRQSGIISPVKKKNQNKFLGSSQAQKITVQVPDDAEIAMCRHT